MAFGLPAKYSEKIELNVSRQTTRGSVEYALGLLGWSLSQSDADTFTARTRMSGSSWGEVVTISLSEPGSLYIESKCYPFQLFDWGKNKQNATAFLSLFESRVIRDAKLLNEIAEEFERDNESRVDRFLNDNKALPK